MRLRHIEVFHAVYVTGSVTAAARMLNISQPAVTKTLRHAEESLRMPLFHRLQNRLVPNADAHSLFADIADIQQRLGSLRRKMSNLKGGEDSLLRIATLPSLGLDVVPEAVAAFLRRRPGSRFDLQTIHHADVPRALFERETDAVIAFDVPTHLSVLHQRLGEGELGLLARREDGASAAPHATLAEIAGLPLISVLQSGPLGDLLAGDLDRLGVVINEVASARTFYMAAALVRAGAASAIVDSFTARSMLGRELVFRPLRPAIRFNVQAITLASRPPTGNLGEFMKRVANVLRRP